MHACKLYAVVRRRCRRAEWLLARSLSGERVEPAPPLPSALGCWAAAAQPRRAAASATPHGACRSALTFRCREPPFPATTRRAAALPPRAPPPRHRGSAWNPPACKRTNNTDACAAQGDSAPLPPGVRPASMPPKSSRFRGVTLVKPTGKWRAQISAGACTQHLQRRALAPGRACACPLVMACRALSAPCALSRHSRASHAQVARPQALGARL